MRRREFITIGGGAAVWPLAARAQQPALPIIAFLRSEPLGDAMHLVAAFRAGLKEAGFGVISSGAPSNSCGKRTISSAGTHLRNRALAR